MNAKQLDLFKQHTEKTALGPIDYVTYKIQGVEYGFPKMTQLKDSVLEDVEDILYCEPPLNSARKKAYAKMYSAIDEDGNQLFDDYTIESYIETKFSEVYHEVYYNIANEVKLQKKIETAITYLDKHNVQLVPEQRNDITLKSFADKALCDGVSYARIISWIPKLKKCKNIDELEASIEEFYNKYEIYYEEIA